MDRNPAFPGDFVNPILQMVQWDIHVKLIRGDDGGQKALFLSSVEKVPEPGVEVHHRWHG